jgi:hypothetical protein
MKRVYVAIFLVSCAVLMLEISLTRLFSIYFSYHFAFMVISIAMLGTGSAGTVLSLLYRRNESASENSYSFGNIHSRLSVLALLAGLSIVLGYVVSNHVPFDPIKISWDRMQIFYVMWYYLALSVPFFFAGMLIATAFTAFSDRSEIIYGSDLIGAGTGSLAALWILNNTGPEVAIMSASTLCFVASIATGGKTKKVYAVLLLAVVAVLLSVRPDFMQVRLSPYKGLSLSLKYPGSEHLKTYYNSFSRIDTLKSPALRFAPGLSLEYLKPLPVQTGMSVDGGELNAVTRADNKDELEFLEFLPSALPYKMISAVVAKKTNAGIDVLVLEPKGGLQALAAETILHPASVRVHKIESNPLIISIIRQDLGEFSGDIFKDNTWSGLGRSLLHASRRTHSVSRTYDVIDIPLTGVSLTGAFGISEEYRYTVEAFNEYIDALEPEGIMSISLYILPPPRVELRMLGTVIEALERRGIKDVSRHIAAIRSWDSIVILVKRSPLSSPEIKSIKEFSRDKRFDLLYYHGIQEDETNVFVRMPSSSYFRAFNSLIHKESRAMFRDHYLFDIDPVYDDNPFFHYYLKLDNIKVIYEVMGEKWQYFIEEGYLLPVVLVQVSLLSLLLIVLPVRFSHRLSFKKKGEVVLIPAMLYFAMLGAGYMFVEITLIQKSIVSLVNPAYAVAAVLTSILVGSGIGSMISSRFRHLSDRVLIMIFAMVIVYSIAFPYFLGLISPYSIIVKIMLVFIALMPLGFFMGCPFPAGIRLVGQKNNAVIPWAWAVNGCLSVLAPILTIMIAMESGFKTVLWIGAVCYLIAFFALRKMQ